MDDANRYERILGQLMLWGCDIEGALPRFINDKAFYCRLLSSIPGETSFDELGAALDAGNVKAAFEQAHALKGVLGNMGLTPMYEKSCSIVEPLRAGKTDGVADLYRELIAQRDKLTAILRTE